jgi:LSD1 subclass zinc finger protein
MKARIRLKGIQVRAECRKCGRFLSEVHGSTNSVVRCSSCKRDNNIRIVYAKDMTARLT